jgi:hypothetical protein
VPINRTHFFMVEPCQVMFPRGMHKIVSESDDIFQAIRPRLNVRVMVYNPIAVFTFFIMIDLMKMVKIGW